MAKDKPKKGEQPAEKESFAERQAQRLRTMGRPCTQQENEDCMGIVMAVAAGEITEAEGQKRIRLILGQDPPF